MATCVFVQHSILQLHNKTHESNMIKLKIVIIGPTNCGKTTISNFLSDATDSGGGEYRPTKGVRIVEFETQNLNVNNRNMKAEIELWDCSGDKKYQSCWLACYRDAQGVIFVYDPSSNEQINELNSFFDLFAIHSGVGIKNCLLIAHSTQNATKATTSLSSNFSQMTRIMVNVEENGNKLRSEFNNFVSDIICGVHDHNEREELSIINLPIST